MELLAHSPRFSAADAQRLARELYGISAGAGELTSERDQNFLLRTAAGDRFVLKIANALESVAFLDAQRQAMERVAERTGLAPRVRPLANGEWMGEARGLDGARHAVRQLTWQPGVVAGTVRRRSPEYRNDLGHTIASVSRALEGFDHPAAHRAFHWDLARGVVTCRGYLPLVADAALRRTVSEFIATFELNTAPLLPGLPRSVIHGDANDFNIILREDGDLHARRQRVAGIIDFGDMVYSHTVGDLAIAAAYAALGARDPLAAIADVVGGYHAARALSDDEISAVFGLVVLRLCTSVCMAAHQLHQRPGDEYLAISQIPIKRTLPALTGIPSRFAHATLRHACGFTPVAATPRIQAFVVRNAAAFAPVLGAALDPATTMPITLDVATPFVSNDPVENTEPQFTQRIFAAMARRGATVAFGGYGEPRMVYSAPAFADSAAAAGERRTVHLGVDLFAPAGTPVHAPLEGVVAAFANNAVLLDYGPVIVLEHSTDTGEAFYTLYGHLSAESLEGKRVGQHVAKGERIASFGTPDVNGGWTPHLHFQMMSDLLDLGTDFPGVARPSQRDVWLSFCPDPSRLLGIPVDIEPAPPPTKAATLETRRRRLGGNLSIAYRDPVKIARGMGQYLFDDDGRRYIDAYNNVPHVGHAHPRVVRAAHEQMMALNTNTRYPHDAVNRLADRICGTLPESLGVCDFVNSGSEANELALRLARAHTRARDMIVLEAAYHGNSTTLVDISPYKHAGPGGAGAPDWVHTVPIPDVYRGQYHADDPRAGEKYAADVMGVVVQLAEAGKGLAGYIAESLPSVGGQIVFPDGYLRAVYRYVRDAGGVCIADEVQTGYGRIGTHFWGFEQQGVVPDIVVLGKPMGNGYPIGAVVTTRAIAESFDNGMEFFSTFGGSTVSSVVGLEVIDVVLDERLQAHALAVGDAMLTRLRELGGRYDIVGDVRGSGLFLGVELVRDRATREPAGAEASFVANRMREEGILLGTDGPFHNVVKIRPPMPFSLEDGEVLVQTLDRILFEDFDTRLVRP